MWKGEKCDQKSPQWYIYPQAQTELKMRQRKHVTKRGYTHSCSTQQGGQRESKTKLNGEVLGKLATTYDNIKEVEKISMEEN